ncbi:MAG TPA: AAA family ATPase [Candidatus Onthovivens sp.]|nr:AAA family ATPase [Candidatus Onthovivens sp.]
MNRIYLITGLMASGKSTLAEALAKRLDKSVHLRGDYFRKAIINGRVEMSENPTNDALDQLHLRYQLTAMVAINYYKEGFNVIIQDNYYGNDLLYIIELLKEIDLKVIVLDPSLEVIKLRENNRNKKGYTNFKIEDLYKSFHDYTPRVGSWIDNSKLTIEETVDKIINLY